MIDNSLKSYLENTDNAILLDLASYPGGVFPEGDLTLALDTGDRGPLSRLLGGRVQPLGWAAPRPVVAMIARDAYPAIDEDASRLNNPAVEDLWQEYYLAAQRHPALHTLASQLDPAGRLRPFAPLLYCQRKRRFFEPLCPHCGGTLTLCTDDSLLASSGLKPYTASLRRYLSCPACHQTKPVFYAAVPESLAAVQGPDDLVTGWGGLAAGDLPCIGCAARGECFGEQALAKERIVPVAFYPFHLLIFDAAGLSALDFLSLAAGRPLAELAQGLFSERPLAAVPKPVAASPIEQAIPEAPPAAVPPEEAVPAADAQIGQIIHDIRTRWASAAERTQTAAQAPAVPVAPPAPTTDLTPGIPPTAPAGDDEDFHTETIIMRQGVPPAQPELPPRAPETSAARDPLPQVPMPEADPDATIVMAPAEAPPAEVKSPPAAVPPRAAAPPAPAPAAVPTPVDDLTETVIIGKPAAVSERATPAEVAEKPRTADDELAETVIMKPKK